MNYKNLSIIELHQMILNKEITVEELTNQVIQNIEKELKSNFLNTFSKNEAIRRAKELDDNISNDLGLLFGIPYFAKDNISTKGIKTTSSSKILENYIPTFNANVIDLLNDKNTVMMGKTALDELGMGGTGLHSAFGPITNPRDSKRQVGGSSSGSVYAVAKGIVPFALGTDTGDSIRKPASYNGVVGFKPTYGAVSRYGLLPYAPSLDHIGVFARNVDDIAIVSDAIIEKDLRDFTTQEIIEKDFYKNINNANGKKIFGYFQQTLDVLDANTQKEYDTLFSKLRAEGHEVKKVGFRTDLLNALSSVYIMISFSEAVSTNANIDGINFGKRAEGKDFSEIMTNTRTKNFGEIVKKRFIIGSLNLKKENQEIFLKKAKQVRRLIVEELNKTFEQIDILVMPPTDDIAPLVEGKTGFEGQHRFIDDLLTLANFNGMPSITIPFIEKEGMPIGINLSAQIKKDLSLLQAAKIVENVVGIKNRIVGEQYE